MTPEELVGRYQTRYARLRDASERRMAALWTRHGGLNDTAASSFSRAAADLSAAAILAAAQLVEAYLTASRTLAGIDSDIAPTDLQALTDGSLRGVDPLEQYARPIVTARVAIADGKTFDKAMKLAAERALVLVTTDLALAQRAATTAAGGDDRVVGYRRVLTGASCALCATASTQRYRTADLMPIHSHCDCGIAEIYGQTDPGHIINQQRLDVLKSRPLGDDPNYWTSRHFTLTADDRIELPEIAVQPHGELGLVLTFAGHAHTGPADIAA